jgi:hypothetical protein
VLAEHLGFVSAADSASALALSAEVGRMLRGLMRALQPPQVTYLSDPAQRSVDGGAPVDEGPPS